MILAVILLHISAFFFPSHVELPTLDKDVMRSLAPGEPLAFYHRALRSHAIYSYHHRSRRAGFQYAMLEERRHKLLYRKSLVVPYLLILLFLRLRVACEIAPSQPKFSKSN